MYDEKQASFLIYLHCVVIIILIIFIYEFEQSFIYIHRWTVIHNYVEKLPLIMATLNFQPQTPYYLSNYHTRRRCVNGRSLLSNYMCRINCSAIKQ